MTSEMKRLLLASTLLMGLPVAAQAQDTAATSGNETDAGADTGAIVVTGSRLSNANLEQAAPIMAVSREEIKLTGQVNVENILKDLPQVLPGATASSNNPGGGVATADLRGLGAVRTLILVNGRRYVSYDTNQVVDLNTIPTALIERVDVVTGGKSAVYGSDAVSGVVNFVTKQDYDGVQANANYRLTGQGDGAQYGGGLLVGKNFADGRGNITLYGDYMRRNPILQSARKYTATTQTEDGAGGLTAGGSSYIPQGAISLDGNRYMFNQDGSYRDYTSADAYNYASENYLQVPQKRELLFGQAHFDVSDHLTIYGEGQYVHNRVENQLAPTPLSGTYEIDTNSSFLSADSQALLKSYDTDGDGYTSASVYRRLNEVGNRISVMDSKAVRGLIGARGNISGDWNYDAYFSYARTRQVEHQYGNVSASRVQQALMTTRDSAGNLVCTDTSNGCVPLNIFGAGNISQAAADFISIDTVNRSTITEKVASGAITNNSLFDLGAGPAGLAFGAEYRNEHGKFEPDAALSSGDVIGFNASGPTAGGYNVKELFAEIDVPLLADKPFIDRLAFNGAYRFSDYSTAAGQVGTFSAGLVWAPVKDISLRGQYSRAVRAPTVADLYSGSIGNYETASDPCATSAALSNATLNASCIASGVPAGKIGNFTTDPQILSYNAGNSALREETANTWTFGTVIQPRFIPGFSLTVDYYNIKIDNFITTATTNNIVGACYGTAANGWTPYNTDYCSLLPRDPTSYNINGAIDNLTNSGGVKTDGIDFDARYTIPLAFGVNDESKLDLRFSGTRLMSWKFTPIATISDMSYDCAGKFGLLCGNVYAKWRLNSRVTWSTEGKTLSLAWRHLSPVKDDDVSTDYSVEKIKAFDYFDLAASIDVAKQFTWSVGMNNMFNKKPPILGDNQEQANTYPSTYDVYGRTLFMNVTVDF
ncbi:TonB-dependent receptor-like protein [Novosphingobium sp. PhB165]|uniref:TonB-dependent receptor n=1 Tax=Novosphingobium sp. PhB165 TaxID=2485105 RepID=UPI00104F0857|nr:TonB-dependent receptor [Novosphingobium sp. PhB165]TCM22434.1 TonB-dependent receptor-like protein [Novosphingobium sp. PhB165]